VRRLAGRHVSTRVADALIHQAEAGATASKAGMSGHPLPRLVRLVQRNRQEDRTPRPRILVGDAEYLIAHCP
jgi:hypothetical protein